MVQRSLLLIGFLLSLNLQAQKKSLEPLKTDADIIVDGYLSDSIWQYAPEATDFVMLSPGSGEAIPQEFETRVKVFYTDEAICFGLIMNDPQPDSILRQVTVRDDMNQNHDWLAVAINPFNDGQNDFTFFVSASGTQADSRTTANGEDYSINSIWYSEVRITETGWVCEIKIPYISLRFPNELQKDWGFNVIRSIRRSREEYSWNYIDRGSGYSWEYQAGLLKNIRNIDPPIRLSLMPYASTYVDNFKGNTELDFNAGMDLKYGINQSFTLDATLIPDFGQVAFDNQVLNLSPFEIQFQENRQFFNEGTELFSLGDLLYSRRIGGAPKNITNQDLNDTNDVTVRTEFTRLLNATKISGRTNNNLGIAFLNAVTDNNYSSIDSAGTQREELLEPLTNYNILVLDQRFNRNSSVSFVNTNVIRNGKYTDGNVAALLASIFNKSGQYRLDLQFKRSDRFLENDDKESGEQYYLRFGDVDGHWRWATRQDIITEDYNPNDLGFLARSNLFRNYSELEYLTFKPSGPFNRTSYALFSVYSQLFDQQSFEEFYLGLNTFFLLRDFTGTGLRLRLKPIRSYDYFEPRTPGERFLKPMNFASIYFLSTDYRKPFALDVDLGYDYTPEWDRSYYNINLEPRIRLGDHFFMIPQLTFDLYYNDYGFAAKNQQKEPIFGRRDRREIIALIYGRYAFNPKASLGLRLRHYWSRVDYKEYFDLRNSGELSPNEGSMNFDGFFNAINLDLRFSWWFAPASEMVILYRVALSQDSDLGGEIQNDYFQNLNNAFDNPVQNNLSIRLAYFLDYDRTRRQLSGKKN